MSLLQPPRPGREASWASSSSLSEGNTSDNQHNTRNICYIPLSRPSIPTSPPPAPRTIVCEGKLSVLLHATGSKGKGKESTSSSGESTSRTDIKLRRRSLTILRSAFASVMAGGAPTPPPPEPAAAAARSASGNAGKVVKEKWYSVQAWLDDAALMHFEGSFPIASTGAVEVSKPPTRPGIKWRLSQDLSGLGRKSMDGMTVKLNRGDPRKSLDVWDRRSWSVEGEPSSSWPYDTSIPSNNSSQSSLFFAAPAAPPTASLTTFRVLSVDRDPSGTVLLLHVEPYTIPPPASPSASDSASAAPPQFRPAGQIFTLYLRFRSPSKLDRWRAALSLAVCVAQARSEVESARIVERKLVEADQLRRLAEQEKDVAEKKLKKEKKVWEKKAREMFSAEEVQDVYQETADQLAEAERRIGTLEATLASEKLSHTTTQNELHLLRQRTEQPMGEYNQLLLRHEEMCKKYEDQKRENVMVRALYEKELTAHKRLAALLRKQALEGVANVETLADAQMKGLVVLSPPVSPRLPGFATVGRGREVTAMGLQQQVDMSGEQAVQDEDEDLVTSLPGEIERRVAVDWRTYSASFATATTSATTMQG
ncbi:hypothetical protein DFJ77DRAFT_436837 [Powellomyces hirtus]|nr:hypothetical protein DFJ77DRAFT_436837 [Powellomyces hirtus]